MTTNQKQRSVGGVPAIVVWTITGIGLIAIGLTVWTSIRAGFFGTGIVSILGGLSYVVALIAFVLSGAVILTRQPRNIIGWLLIIPGISVAVTEPINNWLYALPPPVEPVGLGIWLAVWFTNWSWILLVFPIFLLFLTFPEGKPLSRRWMWMVWLVVGMALFMLGTATFFKQLPVENDQEVILWSISNPIGFIPESFGEAAFGAVWIIALVTPTVLGVVAFIRRFRAGSALVRQQLKWPMYAVAFFGVVYSGIAVASGAGSGSTWDALFGLSLAAIPVSVALAVLRYRLYDLDRIVSRTVTYLVVALLLIAAYGLVVLGVGSFLGRDNPVAVAVATLAAAALFNPVGNRIGRWVDQRFNRPRFDAERVIDGFTTSLRDRVDSVGIVDGWVDVVSETMHPDAVGVWIRH